MFIPYSVDVPFDRKPVMNWLICALVLLAFCAQIANVVSQTDHGVTTGEGSQQTIGRFVLNGWRITGLFGYMWLHGGILHLVGNLLFLRLFGNAVCSKIGNIRYAPVYIGLGLIAAFSHLLFSGGRAIGASGAINGIVGMYLVFFPENSISCFIFMFFRLFTFSVSGYWLILLWFIFDIWGALSGSPGVAYFAHIGGFLGGFGMAVLMLKNKWVVMQRDEKSLLQLLGGRKAKMSDAPTKNLTPRQQQWEHVEKINPRPEIMPRPGAQQAPYIRFSCRCGQKMKIAGAYAGQIVKCPKCSNRVRIPETPAYDESGGKI